MAQQPNINQFRSFVITAFGNRGGDGTQQPTAAVGFIRDQQGIYVAKQGGPVHGDLYQTLQESWKWGDNLVDADSIIESRYLATTNRKLSEWTSYHAEMVILSAMLCANNVQPNSLDDVKNFLAYHGGAVICANATACHHCGSLMQRLGIEFYGGIGKRGLTGWWNPLNDKVYAKSDSEFSGKNVPGF